MSTSANFQEPRALDVSRDQFASCHLVSGSREIEKGLGGGGVVRSFFNARKGFSILITASRP